MNLKPDNSPDQIDDSVKQPELKEKVEEKLKIVEDLENDDNKGKDRKTNRDSNSKKSSNTSSISPSDNDSLSIEKNSLSSNLSKNDSSLFENLPKVWPGFVLAWLFLLGLYLNATTSINGLLIVFFCAFLTTIWWSYCIVKTHIVLKGKTWFERVKPVNSVNSIIITKLFHVFFTTLFLLTAHYPFRKFLMDANISSIVVIGVSFVFLYWMVKEALWSIDMSNFISCTKSQQKYGANVKSFVSNVLYASHVTLVNFTTLIFAPILAPILISINNMRLRSLVDIKAAFDYDTKKKKIIRYRKFAAIEKWLVHRFTKNKSKYSKTIQVVMVILAPVLLFLGFAASIGILVLLTMLVSNSDSSAAAEIANQANSKYVISAFLASLAAGFMGMYTIYKNSPTHIEFNDLGIVTLKKGSDKWITKDFCPWSEINEITMQSQSTKNGASNNALLFHRNENKTPIKINLNSVPSIEEKQDILTSIEKYAPKIKRSSDVILALQLPAEHSYTELWLQALAAPPKREKLQPLQPGAVVREGRYRIQRKLGVGGQGFAYLAIDNSTEKTVVLKEFILPVFVDIKVRKAALEQFESEAKILGKLDHPQIVKLEDFMVEDHRAYLVLEHIDGKSLRELVKENGPLPEEQVKSLAKQMCTVLDHLHSQSPPVVHRDFTPDNLILKNDGTLKLIDFNVAQQTDSTTIAKVVGKQSYLPTEQFQGKPSSQSDIYAMGCTLHFLLTGADPVPISQSKPKDKVSTLSENINNIVSKATENSLKDRYKLVNDIQEDLDYSIDDLSKTDIAKSTSELKFQKVSRKSQNSDKEVVIAVQSESDIKNLSESNNENKDTHLATKAQQTKLALTKGASNSITVSENENTSGKNSVVTTSSNLATDTNLPSNKADAPSLQSQQIATIKTNISIGTIMFYLLDFIAIMTLLLACIWLLQPQ